MGYPHGQKGWRLFDLEKEQFFVSRDVVFSEKEFPFSKVVLPIKRDDNVEELWASISTTSPHLDIHDPLPFNSPSSDWAQQFRPNLNANNNCSTPSSPMAAVHDESVLEQLPTPTTTTTHDRSSTDQPTSSPPPPPMNPLPPLSPSAPPRDPTSPLPLTGSPVLHVPSEPQPEPLGRGYRKKAPSLKLRGFITNTVSLASPFGSNSAYPISSYLRNERFSTSHQALQTAIISAVEPKTYKQAVLDKNWRKAMSEELTAHDINQKYSIVSLPAGKKAIGSRWVYKLKFRADGTLERYKARLVAMGNRQVEGEDYGETFAPVAKMDTVRMFLRVAAGQGFEVHQMDVHNAFLHGDLGEEVYMKLPPGFTSSTPNQVCLLHKSLYGLKQAPRCWFAKLCAALLRYGFQESRSDYSLFVMKKNGSELRVLVYVDDLIIAGNTSAILRQFKAYLSSCFHMKDLGYLKYFLGIEVARNSTGFYLCQRKYTLEIIEETGLLGAKPATFPMPQNHRLALSGSPLLQDPAPYRRLVGRLVYLKVTRPDISYAVHTLSQFLQHPREDHWEAALRVVRYLKLSPGQGILLQSDPNMSLSGWCDSDWASCPLSRKSVTGYFVQLGSSPVAWKTQKQKTVSRSSAEAEYRAMSSLAQELVWLKSLLVDLGILHTNPMLMFCDRKSAIHIGTNPVFHERTKHIEVDCHYVRDEIISGNILPSYVPTTTQLADILTKALGRKEFEFFIDKLGITNLHAPT